MFVAIFDPLVQIPDCPYAALQRVAGCHLAHWEAAPSAKFAVLCAAVAARFLADEPLPQHIEARLSFCLSGGASMMACCSWHIMAFSVVFCARECRHPLLQQIGKLEAAAALLALLRMPSLTSRISASRSSKSHSPADGGLGTSSASLGAAMALYKIADLLSCLLSSTATSKTLIMFKDPAHRNSRDF